jgi:hypothetical protein
MVIALDSRYRAQLPAAYGHQESKFPFPEAAGSLQGANVRKAIRQRRGTDQHQAEDNDDADQDGRDSVAA